jgi:hypothetical protein
VVLYSNQGITGTYLNYFFKIATMLCYDIWPSVGRDYPNVCSKSLISTLIVSYALHIECPHLYQSSFQKCMLSRPRKWKVVGARPGL